MNEAQRDAWLAEMWPVCRELSKGERQAKRQADLEQRIEHADRFPQGADLSTSDAA